MTIAWALIAIAAVWAIIAVWLFWGRGIFASPPGDSVVTATPHTMPTREMPSPQLQVSALPTETCILTCGG